MIQVAVLRGGDGNVRSIDTRGHADFANAGEDIVCAAVSALMQTAALWAEKTGGSARICEKPAQIVVAFDKELPIDARRDGQVVLTAIADGLIAIRDQYAEYITIREV